jgi:polar amino acid transport system substrate-binding protein
MQSSLCLAASFTRWLARSLALLSVLFTTLCLLSLFMASRLLAAQTTSLSAPLKFCIEDTEFLPFNYFVRENGKPTSVSDGYDIELLSLAFASKNLSYQVHPLPWVRCLQSVRNGKFDAAMSASLNAQREIDFRHSVPYYHLTPSYFYLQSSFTSDPKIKKLEDLVQYGRVCGIRGFNYAQFGWPEQLNLIETPFLSRLPEMLKKKRCQFFLDRKEIFYGTLALKHLNLVPAQMVSRPVPNGQKESFHMLVSRKSQHQEVILTHFNALVLKMESRGELTELLNKHQEQLSRDLYSEE